MTVLVIGANNLRRLVRERENLFFVFALPLLLIPDAEIQPCHQA